MIKGEGGVNSVVILIPVSSINKTALGEAFRIEWDGMIIESCGVTVAWDPKVIVNTCGESNLPFAFSPKQVPPPGEQSKKS